MTARARERPGPARRVAWGAALLLASILSTATAGAGEPRAPADEKPRASAPAAELELPPETRRRGRAEASLLFTGSLLNNTTRHLGFAVELAYRFTELVGASLSLGYFQGAYSKLIVGDHGILAARIDACVRGSVPCTGDRVETTLYDAPLITGFLEVQAQVMPLRGQLNLTADLPLAFELYLAPGLGLHGTRTPTVKIAAAPALGGDFTVEGDKPGDGGFLSEPQFNGTLGLGVRLFFADRLTLRAELRILMFADTSPATALNPQPEAVIGSLYLAQLGLGVLIF